VTGRARRRLWPVEVFRSGKKFIDPFSSLARRLTVGDDFFFFQAPAVIVVTADSAVNGALAAAGMELVAEAQGLGVLYSGFFAIAAKHSAKLQETAGSFASPQGSHRAGAGLSRGKILLVKAAVLLQTGK
jgi:hypothetical protein